MSKILMSLPTVGSGSLLDTNLTPNHHNHNASLSFISSCAGTGTALLLKVQGDDHGHFELISLL